MKTLYDNTVTCNIVLVYCISRIIKKIYEASLFNKKKDSVYTNYLQIIFLQEVIDYNVVDVGSGSHTNNQSKTAKKKLYEIENPEKETDWAHT